MSTPVKVTIIGAGSAQFSLGIVKDLCLAGNFRGSHITFMDIDDGRLDMIYRLATKYARQIGADLTFEKTQDRRAALEGCNYVLQTVYVLGHTVEAKMRDLAQEKYGYYHSGGSFGPYHQLSIMLDVARDIERICPDAWLIQSGNPVFDGCTLMTRETGVKVCGLCHGHYGYQEIARTIGLDPEKVTWQAPGLNHNIWLTHFIHEGKDAYPLIDEWIATKGEEYWRTHVAERTHDAQMSRGAAHQYHLYGLFPIGDTVRRGGWWYHTGIDQKKRWFGEPWGGPDTHLGRPFFVKGLEERIRQYNEWADDPAADLPKLIGTERTHEQIVPIMDGLTNDVEGYFQVNVPNHGALAGVPDNVVVEVPAIVNRMGIRPIRAGSLPPKIMLECILPDWLEMERDLLAFKTGDRSMLLYNVLENHQTRSYDAAVALLDDLLCLEDVYEVEQWEEMEHIVDHYKYPAEL